MKEELEKFVRSNRSAFDDHKVDKDTMWERIDMELSTGSESKVRVLWKQHLGKIAACAILILGGALLFNNFSWNAEEQGVVYEKLSEVDTYYGALIDQQIALVKNNPNLSVEEQEDFLSLIDELDEEYGTLKDELNEGINNDKVIEAIINNYRKKIQLMEKLLKRSNPSKNEYDEKEIIL
ncbi:MAG: hypothetical protein K0U54_11525 [Bacteroidetes bacterium]|nr:hypothetical protein [Bacteroidota bacterium]